MPTNNSDRSFRVLTVGEQVVDLYSGVPDTYIRLMGGSPGNTAMGLVKLGLNAAVFAAVGKSDPHGPWIINELEAAGIDAAHVAMLDVFTTQSWITVDPASGQRHFNFVPGAHCMISLDQADAVDYPVYCVMHLTSVLQAEPVASQVISRMIAGCNEIGVFVSYDPNLRPTLWGDTNRMIANVLYTLPEADMIKVSDEELETLMGLQEGALTGPIDLPELTALLESAVRSLFRGRNQIFVVTLGARGAFWFTATGCGHVETISVNVVDTTGAGDAFDAGMIAGLAPLLGESGKLGNIDDKLNTIVHRACVFASLSTRAKGAVAGLPTLSELDTFLTNLK